MTRGPRRLASLTLPELGSARAVLLAGFLFAVSTGTLMASLAIYLFQVAHISPGDIGLGMLIAGCVALVAVPIAGALVDRHGARPMAIAFGALATTVLPLYTLVTSLLSFLLVESVLTTAMVGFAVALRTLTADLFEGRMRVRFQAYHRTVMNLGISVGSVLAIAPLQAGRHGWYAMLFATDAALASIAAGCIWLGPRPRRTRHRSGVRPIALRDAPFVTIAGLFGLLFIRNAVMTIAVPLWIVTSTTLPRSTSSLFLLANALLVVLFQVTVSRRADTLPRARKATRTGVLYLAGSCLLIALCPPSLTIVVVVTLCVGVTLITWGEMLTSTAEWTFSYELADARAAGQYQGVFVLGRQIGDIAGPPVATSICIGLGRAGWVLTGLVFLSLGSILRPATAWAMRQAESRGSSEDPRTVAVMP